MLTLFVIIFLLTSHTTAQLLSSSQDIPGLSVAPTANLPAGQQTYSVSVVDGYFSSQSLQFTAHSENHIQTTKAGRFTATTPFYPRVTDKGTKEFLSANVPNECRSAFDTEKNSSSISLCRYTQAPTMSSSDIASPSSFHWLPPSSRNRGNSSIKTRWTHHTPFRNTSLYISYTLSPNSLSGTPTTSSHISRTDIPSDSSAVPGLNSQITTAYTSVISSDANATKGTSLEPVPSAEQSGLVSSGNAIEIASLRGILLLLLLIIIGD